MKRAKEKYIWDQKDRREYRDYQIENFNIQVSHILPKSSKEKVQARKKTSFSCDLENGIETIS